MHAALPEAVLDTNFMFVAYYNSKADIYLPANTYIELSEWECDERPTNEDTSIIDCLFSTANIIFLGSNLQ